MKEIYLEIDEAEYPLFLREKLKEAIPDEIRNIIISAMNEYTNERLDKEVIEKTVADLNLKLDKGILNSKIDKLKIEHAQANTDEEGLEILNKIQQVRNELFAIKNK